jgi:hypothetical protein
MSRGKKVFSELASGHVQFTGKEMGIFFLTIFFAFDRKNFIFLFHLYMTTYVVMYRNSEKCQGRYFFRGGRSKKAKDYSANFLHFKNLSLKDLAVVRLLSESCEESDIDVWS